MDKQKADDILKQIRKADWLPLEDPCTVRVHKSREFEMSVKHDEILSDSSLRWLLSCANIFNTYMHIRKQGNRIKVRFVEDEDSRF